MLYTEIIAVCSQIRTKHIYTLCEQSVKLLNVKQVVPVGFGRLIGFSTLLCRCIMFLLFGGSVCYDGSNVSDLNYVS